LFERAKKMSQGLEIFKIEHVRREQNREADALVNQALDETSRPRSPAAEKPAARENAIRMVARCKDGRLEPEEPLNLPDGTEVEILLRLRK
jgi:hypothetical protein